MTSTEPILPPPGPTPAGLARVAVDVRLAHLDRFFDYTVPPAMQADAVVGAKVRVRFAGRLCDGFIVERPTTTSVTTKLSVLSKVVSAEPVLHPEQVRLLRVVADHYAGTFADILRLAVPPRHAATEQAVPRPWPEPQLSAMPSGGLFDYPNGSGFLGCLERGEPRRAFWQVAASRVVSDAGGSNDWVRGLVQVAVATLRAGRGVLLIVPDNRDVVQLRKGLAATLGPGCLAELHSGLGPAARYRNYLAVSRGTGRVLIGTRAAIWAPVANLGLIAVWDDGDDLYAEPRAPYPHVRTVAALRASQQECSLLFAAHARTAEIQAWLQRRWLNSIELTGHAQRLHGPAVRVSGDSNLALERDPLARQARLPRLAFETIRAGLASGPVLVQVPRAGYLVALSCQRCRTPVHCPVCHGPVQGVRTGSGRRLECRWCGRLIAGWSCPVCGGVELRAPVVGSGRTAEELGRAFPGYQLVDSSGERVVEAVGDQPAVVVATPGGEPLPAHGYAAAVLMDAGLLLSRADLRAAEEALRRWLNAVALVRPGADGGTVCLVGPSQDRAVQALVRLDPGGFAVRELADRAAAGFPPAAKLITLDANASALRDMLAVLAQTTQILGPVEMPPERDQLDEPLYRAIVRAPLAEGAALTAQVKAALAIRSAHKQEGPVRVCVDPAVLG